jgi:hypothetical protein
MDVPILMLRQLVQIIANVTETTRLNWKSYEKKERYGSLMFEDLRRFNEEIVFELFQWSIVEYQETIMLSHKYCKVSETRSSKELI